MLRRRLTHAGEAFGAPVSADLYRPPPAAPPLRPRMPPSWVRKSHPLWTPIAREARRWLRPQGGRSAGIGLGGILVIVGIVVAIIWSLWLGIIIALVGLIAFGGFAKGKWH
jgi:hypothetical protein